MVTHRSRAVHAAYLAEPLPPLEWKIDLLAADRVYLLLASPSRAVGSYPTPFTLTTSRMMGGIVSVALSLGLPPVAVSNCLVLYCPDFPLSTRPSDHPVV